MQQLAADLERIGFTPLEAAVYIALVRHGSLTAAGLSEIEALPRTSLYPVLRSLLHKGVVVGGVGYGKRFRAVPPERALPDLVEAERVRIEEHELLAKRLAQELGAVAGETTKIPDEIIEVIRNVRGLSERYQQLQLETERENVAFVKGPIHSIYDDNPAELKMLKRGVEVKAIYEESVLDDPKIGPYLERWREAGEQMRVYPGELAMKFDVFDRTTCLLPLRVPGERSPVLAVIIAHSSLGTGLREFFEFVWNTSEPFG